MAHIYPCGQHISVTTATCHASLFYCGAAPPTGWIGYWTKQLLCCLFLKRGFSASSTHSTPLSFLCSFQKVQHHHSTGAAAAVQGRLLCRVRWIPSSSWPDRGYHRDVCSVGLKDQHSLPRNTRVQGTGAELLIALLSSNNSREENIRHCNASHCHYFFQLMEDQILQKYRKYKKVKKSFLFVVFFYQYCS